MSDDALPAGGWLESVRARIQEAARQAASADPPGYAAFDLDQTCILGDVGQALWVDLIEDAALATSRPELKGLLEDLDPDPPDALALMRAVASGQDAPRREYLERWMPLYERCWRMRGHEEGYAWVICAMVGLSEPDLKERCERLVDRALERPVAVEALTPNLEVRRGLRVIAEVAALLEWLEERGVPCWIVSASCTWPVRAMAARLGVPAERVLASRVVVDDDGRLTDRLAAPLLYRQGKVTALRERLAAPPALAVGDAMTDLEMLASARSLALVLDRGEDELLEALRSRGVDAAVQPRDALELRHTPWREVRS